MYLVISSLWHMDSVGLRAGGPVLLRDRIEGYFVQGCIITEKIDSATTATFVQSGYRSKGSYGP
jgi:hypothetical protein